MSAVALKLGLENFIGKRRAQQPLRAVLRHFMKQPTGTSGTGPAPLAGRRILLAGEAQTLAQTLRQGGADVRLAAQGASLLDQLRRGDPVDAVVLALDPPGTDALQTARAIRGGGEPWAAIPLLGLAGPSNTCAEAAATAAGINGLLVKPVETILLYETLSRFISSGAARAQRPAPAAPATSMTVVPEGFLNLPRLESYQRLGMLDEMVNDYLPEMDRLLADLQDAAARSDVQASLAALHSLLGMSGEAGAQGLYQHVRKLYVPLLEHGQWPATPDWLSHLQQLAARTEEALKAYCAGPARPRAV
jgi:two-component system CAI-1 autoinducer sensor kinase/phosphatase CqsS